MQRIAIYCLIAALGCGTPLVLAGHHSAHRIHCPKCRHECRVEISKEAVKKHCWKVECKTICIPRVTFPWQTRKQGCTSCCEASCSCPQPARGAKTRKVQVLVKHEFECERCKYKWTPCKACGVSECKGGARCGAATRTAAVPAERAPAPVFADGLQEIAPRSPSPSLGG